MNGRMKVMGNIKNHAGTYRTALEYAKTGFNAVTAYIRGWVVMMFLLLLVAFWDKDVMDELYACQQAFFLNINALVILLFFIMELADIVLFQYEYHIKFYRLVRIFSFFLFSGCVSLYGSRCKTPFSSFLPEYFAGMVVVLIIVANALIWGRGLLHIVKVRRYRNRMEWSRMDKKEKIFRKFVFSFFTVCFYIFSMFAMIAVTNSDVIGGMPYLLRQMSETFHCGENEIKWLINAIICCHTFLSFAMIFITIKICEMNYKKKQDAK